MESDVINVVGGIALGLVSYFLKQTMGELKEVKALAIASASKLAVLENDHVNKTESIGEKHDELKESIDKLTDKIDKLTNKIN